MTPPSAPQMPEATARPLDGVRVLEMGQLVAGPFAGTLLAYFGAEVIKIEPPGVGDPIRCWRGLDEDGTSLWWRTLARNKSCITVDLRQPEGRELARRLILDSDVLIENFRPGRMEDWMLGPEDFKAEHPDLIYTRVSGFGQTGPLSSRPGYASVCEAFGGLRYLTGHPGQMPVRANLSLGDSLAGFHAAFGILLALLQKRRPGGQGQLVDVSIFESVFNMLESVVPEYDRLGVVRQPAGTTITGVVPTNIYPCRDDKAVIIGANGDSNFKRLMHAAGRADLAEDPRLAANDGRVRHQEELDGAIAAWTSSLSVDAVLDALDEAKVPAGPIYDAADMFADPQYQARELFESVPVHDYEVKVPAILPKLDSTPGRTEWAGPELGEHTDAVLQNRLGLSPSELRDLREQGVI